MESMIPAFASLDDEQLLVEVHHLAIRERRATARLIGLLAEVEARRLYLSQGCSSLFTYCTQVLRLSADAAYGRIEAVRTVRQFPQALERLASGEITLTGIGVLRPHLTHENHVRLLDAARFRTTREIQELVAEVHPRPDVPGAVRGLAAGSETRPLVDPLAPDRYHIQFTITRATYQKLRRGQDLLRHSIPNGDMALIFDRALTLLLKRLEKAKIGPVSAIPARPSGRYIPRAVQRKVWRRDDGRCGFVGPAGRCAETGGLEFHHVVPYALGGPTMVDNLQLRCRAHNQYEAERVFGPRLVHADDGDHEDGKK